MFSSSASKDLCAEFNRQQSADLIADGIITACPGGLQSSRLCVALEAKLSTSPRGNVPTVALGVAGIGPTGGLSRNSAFKDRK